SLVWAVFGLPPWPARCRPAYRSIPLHSFSARRRAFFHPRSVPCGGTRWHASGDCRIVAECRSAHRVLLSLPAGTIGSGFPPVVGCACRADIAGGLRSREVGSLGHAGRATTPGCGSTSRRVGHSTRGLEALSRLQRPFIQSPRVAAAPERRADICSSVAEDRSRFTAAAA